MTAIYNTEQQTIESVNKLRTAHGYDAADYLREPGLYNSVFENPSMVWTYLDNHEITPSF